MANVVLDKLRYCPPTVSSFTHTYGTNSENPTFTNTSGRGAVFAFGSSPAVNDNVRAVTKNKAASSNYDIIARLRWCTGTFLYHTCGICVSDGTKFVTFGFTDNKPNTWNGSVKVARWTNNTTFSTDNLVSNILQRPYEWLRIQVVSGDPSEYYISENGTDWVKILSQSQTAFLTYTEVGIAGHLNRSSGALPVASTPQMFISCLYFSDPDITPPV